MKAHLTLTAAALVLAFSAPGSAAQPAAPAPSAASSALQSRANDLVRFINGELTPQQLFTPAAFQQVPAERLTALANMIRERRGRALGVSRIDPANNGQSIVYIDFAEFQLALRLAVHPEAPHLITTMMVENPQG